MRVRLACLLLIAVAGGCPSSLIWEFPGGPSYTALVIADANNDGLPDLWFCEQQGGEMRVALRDPLNPRAYLDGGGLAVGRAPLAIAAADLDRDGDVDALVTDLDDGLLRVVLRASDGSFVAHGSVSVGPRGYALAVGDLNRDGWPDAAVGRSEGGVTVVLQDPAAPGTFAVSRVLVGDRPIRAVAIGDIDEDGCEDLIAADMNGERVYLFVQDPGAAGTFLPGVTLGTGVGPNGIALWDLDGNGHPDIAVADYSDDSASVLLHAPAGFGTFLPATDYPTGEYSSAVAVGDLDFDGLPDLALADSDVGRDVSILLQDPASPGGFQPGPRIEVGPALQAVVCADLDGDGRDDLAVARGFFLPDEAGHVLVVFQDPLAPGGFTAPLVIR